MINLNPAHKGMLHRDLGVSVKKKLSLEQLHQAMKSRDPAVRKRANFAINARGFKH